MEMVRLPINVKGSHLLGEYMALVDGKTGFSKQHGPYHDGGWEGLCLWSADGTVENDRVSEDGKYYPTEIVSRVPHTKKFIESLGLTPRRIRYSLLKSGAEIKTHVDKGECLDDNNLRIHIPLISNEKVYFRINGELMRMELFGAYYCDFSLPHSVINKGYTDRVHLLCDFAIGECDNNEYVRFIKNVTDSTASSKMRNASAVALWRVKDYLNRRVFSGW